MNTMRSLLDWQKPIVRASLSALVALWLNGGCLKAVKTKAAVASFEEVAAALDSIASVNDPSPQLLLSGKDFVYKGLYLSPYVAHNRGYVARLLEKSHLFNTLVVDVKFDDGFLVYPSRLPLARAIGASQNWIDLAEFVKQAKAHNLRLIARIVVFKDSYLAKHGNLGGRDAKTGALWQDEAGNNWVDPYSETVWDYNIAIANEVLAFGFDEIQFDYVRFPTDGDVWNCIFYHRSNNMTKEEAIAGFLKRARAKIPAPISVDVYGYATWRVLTLEGQDLSRMGRFVDYVCPMLYPSHFAQSFKRERDEFWRSYWIYYDSVKSAQVLLKDTNARVITYVQGFNYKSPWFGPDYIHTQILAAKDAGASGFFIWHAGGDYSTALEALKWVK